MHGFCNTCNKEFLNDSDQKLHYKSEWHRYNLIRKVAGVPWVTEAHFLARESEKNKPNETPMLYSCGLCGKGYKSSKAHAQHLNSKSHSIRASQGENPQTDNTVVRPLVRPTPDTDKNNEESEWEDVDPVEEMFDGVVDNVEDEFEEEFNPTCCFMCDLENSTLETCLLHMHKKHGFFIPDIEYLEDPIGLLTYLGLKVRRDLVCLFCDERCHPFKSLEAVRKHMDAKGHCKVRYGEEVELEEFYDYSTSYMDNDGRQLVAVNYDVENSVELGRGRFELILKKGIDRGVSAKTIGSREFLRYYRQNPRPAHPNALAISMALASCRKSMGLTTIQLKERAIRIQMNENEQIRRSGKDTMMINISLKSLATRRMWSPIMATSAYGR